MGYGAVIYTSLIDMPHPEGNRGLMASILIANTPQIILSFLYFTYNGLFSCMLLMEEWAGFAYERKPLRVTFPIGMQRSSYWLQLPYKYGVPLLVISGILHWLVSQSIFLARITLFDDQENEIPLGSIYTPLSSIYTCGYSCIAIITVIIFGSIVILFGISNGFRKYKGGMPLIGSCSAAISAACHSLKNDPHAAFLPVMWGAVETTGPVGHCCFSSLDVSPPVEGKEYAGEREKSWRISKFWEGGFWRSWIAWLTTNDQVAENSRQRKLSAMVCKGFFVFFFRKGQSDIFFLWDWHLLTDYMQ